jgi:GT2 family glycosyltransferase
LAECIGLALRQTRAPAEIVIVDSSDDISEGRRLVSEQVSRMPGVRLVYEHSPIKSSTVQRNLAIAAAQADILFVIDDDSFMHADCAEEVMRIYEADPDREVAAVEIRATPTPPKTGDAPLDRKRSGRRGLDEIIIALRKLPFWTFVEKRLLFQDKATLFVEYDCGAPERRTPDSVSRLDVRRIPLLAGCVMTVRREVALREPFDTALRYYAAFEDLDVAHRYTRHGVLLRSNRALLHHVEATGGRMKRKTTVIFQLLNMLVFIKRHALDYDDAVQRYRSMLWRRLPAEAVKDLLSRRWSLPQAQGVLFAIRRYPTVLAWRDDEIDAKYPELQRKIREATAA